jgi:chorismate dehydratase
VSYVNAWPLLSGLGDRRDVELFTATPAGVAGLLASGAVDAGLVPSIELLRQPGLEPLGGVGIASHGPVDSVLVLLRRAPHRVRTLALDPASRTSQVLARLVFEHVFAARPDAVPCDPGRAWSEGSADAVLVIGDQALAFREQGIPCIDLADAWTRWTSLPFVFAVWGSPRGTAARRPALGPMLAESLDRGNESLHLLAKRAAALGPLDEAGFQVYLSRRIRYVLGPHEMRGLSRFLELARCST